MVHRSRRVFDWSWVFRLDKYSPPHPRMEKEPSSLFTFKYETNTNLCFTLYHCISTHIIYIYIYVVYLELSMFMTTFLDEASPSYCIPAQLSVWESWETCSTTCGVGQRNRERTAGLPFWWGGGGGKVVKSWCLKKKGPMVLWHEY